MKKIIVGAVAALIATTSLTTAAEAGHRWKRGWHKGHHHAWHHKRAGSVTLAGATVDGTIAVPDGAPAYGSVARRLSSVRAATCERKSIATAL